MRKTSAQLPEQEGEQQRLLTFMTVGVSFLLALLVLLLTVADIQAMLGHLSQLADQNLTTDMRIMLDIEIAAEAIKVLLDIHLFLVFALLSISGLRLLYVRESKMGAVWFLEVVPRLFLAHNLTGLRRWLVGIILVRVTLRLIQQTLRLAYDPTTDVTYLAILVVLLIGAWVLSFRQQTTLR
jgi:hypothetical protein